MWYQDNGFTDLAVDHAFAAGDVDRAATIVGGAALRYHWSGRRATVRAWLRRFGDAELEPRPWLAVIGALEEAGIGDVAASEHLGDIAERGSFEARPPDGTSSFASGRAILRAVLCRNGADDMLSNAKLAADLEHPGSPWRDLALWTLAYGRLIRGDLASADDALADTVATARANRNHGTCQNALAQRALLAIGDGDWASAVVFAEDAGTIVVDAHLDGYQVTALIRAVLARIAIHRGDIGRANVELSRAASLRPQLTAAIPWLNVTALIAIAQAYLAAGDPAGARTLVVQAEDVVRLRPNLGVLPSQVAALRERVAALPIGLAGASTLTAAELRVLAYLPLYLSFKEIGDRLGVRASTVHTHATAIYGKLGASSRSEAIELAIEAGLLAGRPDWSRPPLSQWMCHVP
jgi:LuxR family maltose regulon positive regulatory protein